MNINRTISLLLLVAVAVFSVGGPGLHHAPFLGFHVAHVDCEEEAQPVACSCGSTHAKSTTPQDIAFAENPGGETDCDGHCSVCEFFATLSFDLTQKANLEIEGEITSSVAVDSVSVECKPTRILFARGPPVA